MGCRLINLKLSLAGYLKTGLSLLTFDGNNILPLFYSTPGVETESIDDVGIYVIIPKIAYFFGISLEQSINIFFYGLIILSAILAIIGFSLIYPSLPQRISCLVSIVSLCWFTANHGDVYIAYTASALAIIPSSIYLCYHQSYRFFLIFMIFAGSYLSFVHYIRTYSSLPVFIFLLTIIPITKMYSFRQRLILLGFLLIGINLPLIFFRYEIIRSNDYIQIHMPDKINTIKHAHPFWHTIYLGFSFLNNPDEQIEWNDIFALKKAREQHPTINYLDDSYEVTIRDLTINLIKKNMNFVILTIFAKLGVLFYYLLKTANIGLLCIQINKFIEYLPFIFALGFASLFPILSVPTEGYSLSFITLAHLFGLTQIANSYDKGTRKGFAMLLLFICLTLLVFFNTFFMQALKRFILLIIHK